MEIMYSDSFDQGYFNNKNFIGFIGEIKDLKALISNMQEVKLSNNLKVKSVIKEDLLSLLDDDIDILKKKIKDLSDSELKIVKLIKTCSLNPKIVILNNFELGFNYNVKRKISKFIKLINAMYHINFVIISNDLLFLNRCAKHMIISKNHIIKYQGDLITAIKQNLVDKPEIIKFIDMANEKNINLEYTLNNKELLKAIYRSVF